MMTRRNRDMLVWTGALLAMIAVLLLLARGIADERRQCVRDGGVPVQGVGDFFTCVRAERAQP